jgi:hypothetical protein
MKIFFNASLRGRKQYEDNYHLIVSVLKKFGSGEVITPIDMGSPESVEKETSQEAESYFNQLIKWISDCDIAVFEVSYSSTGIGHEIAVALNKDKSVIALHIAGKKQYILESICNEKLQVIEYSPNILSKLISEAIQFAKDQQDIRFTFFIQPEIQKYLDLIAENHGISRSEHIRELLLKEMKKNKQLRKKKI